LVQHRRRSALIPQATAPVAAAHGVGGADRGGPGRPELGLAVRRSITRDLRNLKQVLETRPRLLES